MLPYHTRSRRTIGRPYHDDPPPSLFEQLCEAATATGATLEKEAGVFRLVDAAGDVLEFSTLAEVGWEFEQRNF